MCATNGREFWEGSRMACLISFIIKVEYIIYKTTVQCSNDCLALRDLLEVSGNICISSNSGLPRASNFIFNKDKCLLLLGKFSRIVTCPKDRCNKILNVNSQEWGQRPPFTLCQKRFLYKTTLYYHILTIAGLCGATAQLVYCMIWENYTLQTRAAHMIFDLKLDNVNTAPSQVLFCQLH